MNPIKVFPLCALLAACFAPEEKFDDFLRDRLAKLGDAGMSNPEGDGGNSVPLRAEQLEGTYLYAVSVALAPSLPTVYLAEVKAEQVGEQLAVTIRQRPLSKDDWRTPVGDYGEPRSDLVPATGSYTSELVVSVVPAAANAVTGADSRTETVFTGRFDNPATPDDPDAKLQFFCGTMTGEATSPLMIDLSGSTFAATRIPDVDDPDSYPRVVINCDMTPARGQ